MIRNLYPRKVALLQIRIRACAQGTAVSAGTHLGSPKKTMAAEVDVSDASTRPPRVSSASRLLESRTRIVHGEREHPELLGGGDC